MRDVLSLTPMPLAATTIRRDILPVWYFSRRGAETQRMSFSVILCEMTSSASLREIIPRKRLSRFRCIAPLAPLYKRGNKKPTLIRAFSPEDSGVDSFIFFSATAAISRIRKKIKDAAELKTICTGAKTIAGDEIRKIFDYR